MPDSVSFQIRGANELAQALETKPPAAAKRIIRGSLLQAVQPWRDEMIANVHRGWHVFQHAKLRGRRGQGAAPAGREREFGVIAGHIQVRATVDGGGYSGSAQVFPSKGAFWSHFLEFGTRHQRAFPFMRPAFESQKQAVLDKFLEDAREQLRAELGLR